MEKIYKKEIQRLMPLFQAIAEGKTIQWNDMGVWSDIDGDDEGFFLDTFVGKTVGYRIKPEPKYRPFANAEECWQEMLKHRPFGWIKSAEDKNPEVFIHCEVVLQVDGILTDLDEIPFPYDGMYKNYTFTDGTPFGVKIEGED